MALGRRTPNGVSEIANDVVAAEGLGVQRKDGHPLRFARALCGVVEHLCIVHPIKSLQLLELCARGCGCGCVAYYAMHPAYIRQRRAGCVVATETEEVDQGGVRELTMRLTMADKGLQSR